MRRRSKHETTLFILAGILAIILVLWGISYHLDSKINSRDSQNWLSTTGETISILNFWRNLQKKQESKFSMRPLTPTKPCTRKSSRVEQPMILPSQVEYMINKMKDEDLLVPLDYSKIEGIENIGQNFSTSPLTQTISTLSHTSGNFGNCLQ